MQKSLRTQALSLSIILAVFAFAMPSCEKMPGHAVTPDSVANGGSTGGSIGNGTYGTATGTITFQIENGSVNTWTAPNYFMGLGSTPTTGMLAVSTTPGTVVTAGPTDTQLFLTTGAGISFAGITPGTYPMAAAGSFIRIPGMSLTGAGGSETVTVTEESLTITSTSMGTVKGAVKGTFTGQMLNTSTYAAVNVSGTFNVQLQ